MNIFSNISNLQLVEIDVSAISMSPNHPRKVYSDADIESLSQSIMQHGLLQPVCVIKKSSGFELLFGYRRLLAVKKAGLTSILAIIQSESCDQLVPAVIENTQREALNPLDEAEALQALCSKHKYSLKDLSHLVNKSVSLLSEIRKLNVIPADVKDTCRRMGHLKLRFLKELSKFGKDDGIRDAYQYFLEHGKLPTRRTRKYGKDDKRKVFLDKLTEIISEYRDLDLNAGKDEQFQRQVREQIDLFNSLLN